MFITGVAVAYITIDPDLSNIQLFPVFSKSLPQIY